MLLVLQGKGLLQNLNNTFRCLILKIDIPELASQSRPISLCNVAYKIITKCIVNHIKPMMPHLTSCTQTTFVSGCQIRDNILIVQEVIHTMTTKQGKKGYMTIKIDFEKAYDQLKWSFIQNTLFEIKFPQLLISYIMECITTSTMQVLWNGEPTDSFRPDRGIRQGDPLSPYIFVLCMERLNQIIEEAIIANKWKPIQASRNGPKLSNLCFADDIILFVEALVEQAEIIQQCLHRFCIASGSKIIFTKLRVYFSRNMTEFEIKCISQVLGIEKTEDFGMYLGMPTLTSSSQKIYLAICVRILTTDYRVGNQSIFLLRVVTPLQSQPSQLSRHMLCKQLNYQDQYVMIMIRKLEDLFGEEIRKRKGFTFSRGNASKIRLSMVDWASKWRANPMPRF